MKFLDGKETPFSVDYEMRAVVTGMIATYPVGGVAWDYGQYAIALENLGFDVYYLEDTGGATYDPTRRLYGDDCSYGVRFLGQALAQLSPRLADRWHFRDASGEFYGLSLHELYEVIATADLFLNVSGGTLLRDEYMACSCKVLIDTDPGWNHFVNYPRWDARPRWQNTHGYRAHDHFFTYAERLGRADCSLPDMGLAWHPTRPPVVLDRWKGVGNGRTWTTVMTWNNFHKPVEYQGRTYGTKEMEFAKIESIPIKHPGVQFQLATGGSEAPIEKWKRSGWQVVDSHSVSESLTDYRIYIETSRGELSVAKNLYVATKSGWFSCRSACYLAAGRPVIVQDTGFAEILPTGEGLFPFTNTREAEDAIAIVESDYDKQARAARDLAAEYLDGRRIVGNMLQRIGLM
ncbi:MAG TPA: hypothetical protein VFW73_13785 [Lacipirellulaceae bacterium]|nr:hypothetical protein [Lacipirellulaceae bacterium]